MNPEYKPSLMCRIFGHKWWRKATNIVPDQKDPDLRWRNITWHPLSHCDRCGTPAPEGFTIQP